MATDHERSRAHGESGEPTIAFVDLVQFTALTDIHGDRAGAEAATSLAALAAAAGEGVRLVKSIGDGVLLEAATPAAALSATVTLTESVHEILLEARSGLDHGPVVRRHDDVFGRTVNLASRLAAVAQPGMLAMTRSVALEAGRVGLSVSPLGALGIRGFRTPVEVFTADPCSHDGRWFADPVCGMRVRAAGAITSRVNGREFGFCSQICLDVFTESEGRDPAR